MSKFEKRLCIFALVFVALYLGAVVLTIHSRIDKADKIERIESMALTPEKSQLMLVELLLPMLILLTLTVYFIIVRKTRAKKALLPDDSNEEIS